MSEVSPHIQYVAQAHICKLWQFWQEYESGRWIWHTVILTRCNYTCESTQTPDPTNASRESGSNPESCYWMMLVNWMPHKVIKSFSHMYNIQLSRFWLTERAHKKKENRTVAICNCFKRGKFPHKTGVCLMPEWNNWKTHFQNQGLAIYHSQTIFSPAVR